MRGSSVSDWSAVLRTIGLTVAVGAIAAALLYGVVLVLLVTHQRDILFIGGHAARTPDAVYMSIPLPSRTAPASLSGRRQPSAPTGR
jgi:hypothetical protein